MAELADARDLKSRARKGVWVRSPPPAIKIAVHAERVAAEPNVFPGLTPWSDDHRALTHIHGGAWKDLRRTVSTRLAARGVSEEIVGRALNHARYTVTARHYIRHAYLAETRRALEVWDAELADIIARRKVELMTVLPFHR